MKRVLYGRHLIAIEDALARLSSPGDDQTAAQFADQEQALEILSEFLGAYKGKSGSNAPRAVLLTKFEASSLSRAAGNSLDYEGDAKDILLTKSAIDAACKANAACTSAGHGES